MSASKSSRPLEIVAGPESSKQSSAFIIDPSRAQLNHGCQLIFPPEGRGFRDGDIAGAPDGSFKFRSVHTGKYYPDGTPIMQLWKQEIVPIYSREEAIEKMDIVRNGRTFDAVRDGFPVGTLGLPDPESVRQLAMEIPIDEFEPVDLIDEEEKEFRESVGQIFLRKDAANEIIIEQQSEELDNQNSDDPATELGQKSAENDNTEPDTEMLGDGIDEPEDIQDQNSDNPADEPSQEPSKTLESVYCEANLEGVDHQNSNSFLKELDSDEVAKTPDQDNKEVLLMQNKNSSEDKDTGIKLLVIKAQYSDNVADEPSQEPSKTLESLYCEANLEEADHQNSDYFLNDVHLDSDEVAKTPDQDNKEVLLTQNKNSLEDKGTGIKLLVTKPPEKKTYKAAARIKVIPISRLTETEPHAPCDFEEEVRKSAFARDSYGHQRKALDLDTVDGKVETSTNAVKNAVQAQRSIASTSTSYIPVSGPSQATNTKPPLPPIEIPRLEIKEDVLKPSQPKVEDDDDVMWVEDVRAEQPTKEVEIEVEEHMVPLVESNKVNFFWNGLDEDDELLVASKKVPPGMSFMCALCYDWFKTQEEIEAHMEDVHLNGSMFHTCKICGSEFIASFQLQRHEKLHKFDSEKEAASFSAARKAKRPRGNFPEKNSSERFKPCFPKPEEIERLAENLAQIEAASSKFQCMSCDAEFTNDKEITWHYEQFHAQQKCIFCPMTCDTFSELKTHLLDIHKYQMTKEHEQGYWQYWAKVAEKEVSGGSSDYVSFFHDYAKSSCLEPPDYSAYISSSSDEEDENNAETSATIPNTKLVGRRFGNQRKSKMPNRSGGDLELQFIDTKPKRTILECFFCRKPYDNVNDMVKHQRSHRRRRKRKTSHVDILRKMQGAYSNQKLSLIPSTSVKQRPSLLADGSAYLKQRPSLIAGATGYAKQRPSLIAGATGYAKQRPSLIAGATGYAKQRPSLIAGATGYAKQRPSLIAGATGYAKQKPSIIAGASGYAKQRPSIIAGASGYAKQRPSLIASASGYAKQRPSLIAGRSAYLKQRPSLIAGASAYLKQRPSLISRASGKQKAALIARASANVKQRPSIITGATMKKRPSTSPAASVKQMTSLIPSSEPEQTPLLTTDAKAKRNIYPCKFCKLVFVSNSKMIQHEKVHFTSRRQVSVCAICKQGFSRMSELEEHVASHNIKQDDYGCSTCGKRFDRMCSLALHKQAHAANRKYKCEYPGCDKAYNYSSLLKRHERTHSGEKPYQCDLCTVRFSDLVCLHYHRKKVHTGEKPHKCIECGRGFILSSDLKKHMSSVHKNNLIPIPEYRVDLDMDQEENLVVDESPKSARPQLPKRPKYSPYRRPEFLTATSSSNTAAIPNSTPTKPKSQNSSRKAGLTSFRLEDIPESSDAAEAEGAEAPLSIEEFLGYDNKELPFILESCSDDEDS